MKKVSQNRKELLLKFATIAISVMIVIPSIVMFESVLPRNSGETADTNRIENLIPEKPPQVKSVLTEDGTWVKVADGLPGTPVEVYVAVSDTTGLTIVSDCHGFWRGSDNITSLNTIFMPGASIITDWGRPMLPRIIRYVEVPHDIDITLDIIYGEPTPLPFYDIIPAPRQIGPTDNLTIDPSMFFYDDIYSSAAYFPACNVSLEGGLASDAIILRGRRLVEITIYPIQYSPELSHLLFYPRLIAKVNYAVPAQIEPVRAALWSEPFEKLFQAFILNYIPWNPETGTGLYLSDFQVLPPQPFPYVPSSNGLEVAEYLIITHEEFEWEVRRLAEWKTRKGLPTTVTLTKDIPAASPTSTLEEDIEAYIKNAYDTWGVGPTYVLLFGDSEWVPNAYGMLHRASSTYYVDGDGDPLYPYHPDAEIFVDENDELRVYDSISGAREIGTDLEYFKVDGDDYFPDIIYGRISVDTKDEAEIVVDKILAYEITPPSDPYFYNNTYSAAYFQDHPPTRNGIEDSGFPFVQGSEDVRLYLESLGYNCHFNYTANYRPLHSDENHKPSKFYNELNPSAGLPFSEGYPHLYDIVWIATRYRDSQAGNVTLNVNDKRFLVYCIDHGGSNNSMYPRDYDEDGYWDSDGYDGWWRPSFNTTHTTTFTNGEYLPLVISISCRTGWFDGEIDGNTEYPNYECFSENITRMENGGAIAAIGASRISWTLANSHLLKGIIHAFWPGFLEFNTLPARGMGAALLFGKMNTALREGYRDETIQATETTFSVYHLFGDPETRLWTAPPSELSVSHPTQMSTNGPQQFVVSVFNDTEPVHWAKVCIQGEDIYEVGYTDSGGQIDFSINPTSTVPINVTVTKHNFIPYNTSMEVIDCDAVLTLSKNPALGGDLVTFAASNFDTGADIHIYFNETELIPSTLGETSVDRTIPEGRDAFANIKANTTNEVAIVLFTRCQNIIASDPYLYSQNDDETWHLGDGTLTYNNPCIEIYEMVSNHETFVESWDLDQLSNYKIYVEVFNDKPDAVEGVEVTVSWCKFSAGMDWEAINENNPAIITIQGEDSSRAEILWTPRESGHICLQVKLSKTGDENRINNIGQENTDVAALQSPGESWFLVGNPTNETETVYLEVRQQGDHDDVWKAAIEEFSYLAIPSGGFENISLQIESPVDAVDGEWRLFTVSLYIKGVYIGGLSIKAVHQVQQNGGIVDIGPIVVVVGCAIGLIVSVIIVLKRRGTKKHTPPIVRT